MSKQPLFKAVTIEDNIEIKGFGWFETDYTDEFLNEKGLSSQNAMVVTDSGWFECYLDSVKQVVDGSFSDSHHSFDELYYHRMKLFALICNTYYKHAWKSKLHDDGTMYDDYFIVGVTTDKGDYSYHYHLDYWDYFKVEELQFAPPWDGHKPEDINRVLDLLGSVEYVD